MSTCLSPVLNTWSMLGIRTGMGHYIDRFVDEKAG